MPEIVPEEAETVRLIYRLFIEGRSINYIANHLTQLGIQTPRGKAKWNTSTIESILTNEKYKGSAILQKKFTVDFLSKKMKVNEGEVPQYYVEHSTRQSSTRRNGNEYRRNISCASPMVSTAIHSVLSHQKSSAVTAVHFSAQRYGTPQAKNTAAPSGNATVNSRVRKSVPPRIYMKIKSRRCSCRLLASSPPTGRI